MSVDQRVNEDPLLQSLGEMARAEEHAEGDLAQLEALVRGELPESEARLLEQRAASEPELALALEAYRPLEDAAQRRIAERILAEQAQAAQSPERGASVVDMAARARRRRRALRFGWMALPLAAAAAALVWLALPGDGPAPLPEYTLSASGGLQQLRGPQKAAATAVSLQPNSTLTLTLRPATSVDGAVEARAFLRVGDVLRPVAFQAKVSPTGALQLSGTASALFGRTRGAYELYVIVGRTDLIDASASELARGPRDAGPRWQRLTLSLRLLDSSHR